MTRAGLLNNEIPPSSDSKTTNTTNQTHSTNVFNARTKISGIRSAILTNAFPDDDNETEYRKDIQNRVRALISNFDTSQEKVSQEFQTKVLALRSFLSDLRSWSESLEIELTSKNINHNAEFLLDNFSPIFTKYKNLSDQCGRLVSKVNKNDLPSYIKFIQEHLHPLLMSSPFPNRIYSKPLGYAGDYEMMRMIQRENAEGHNLFTQFVNTFYTNIPVTTSVKNRTSNMVRLIEEGVKKCEQENKEFNSISIGCGPALEVKNFLDKHSQNVKTKCNFTLLDFNEETLNFAVNQSNKANAGKLCSIIGRLQSVHSLIKKSANESFGNQKYDLVYCTGLFDYLSDKTCSRLVKMFFNMLKPGGTVHVTNMHSNDTDQQMTELLFEWYLIYRNEEQMKNFAPIDEHKIYTDTSGINLCLEIKSL